MCWTLHSAQVANRKVSILYTGSQVLGQAPEGGSTSKAQQIELLTISFRYPLALAAGHWQKKERRHEVSTILEGANSRGCELTGMLGKYVPHMHIHTARGEKSGQLNLSLMVWRQRGVHRWRTSRGWGGSVVNGQGGRMKIDKEKSKRDKWTCRINLICKAVPSHLTATKRTDLGTGSLAKPTVRRTENWQEERPIVSYLF